MGIDQIFFQLVQTVNSITPTLDLRAMKVLDRGEYGWMEFAAPNGCLKKEAASRYFQRAGALACLVHWLRGIDFHRENLVAAGEYPVPVDLETLAHPVNDRERLADPVLPNESLADSVVRSGLLPLWKPRPIDSTLYDDSAFGAAIAQRSFLPVTCWQSVNSDQMHAVLKTRRLIHSAHRPRLNGRLLSIQAFERDVVLGFRRMAATIHKAGSSHLLRHREHMEAAERRRVKRPTSVYSMLIQRSVRPECLSDGVDRSIELQALPLDQGDETEWRKEIECLERLDIPYFQISRCHKADLTTAPERAELPRLLGQESTLRMSVRKKLRLNGARIEPL